MVRLTILRHAKSSWADPGRSDFDRVLNERGESQLPLLARWVAAMADRPDACICSPARRTVLTWQGIEPALEGVVADKRERLYPGTPDLYLEEIWASQARHLLVIGHNPTCDELAHSLCVPGGDAYERLAESHFGTANWVTLRFDGTDMSAVALAGGTVEHYVKPKDLCDH